MSLTFYLYGDIDCGANKTHRTYIFEGSITHNLSNMARASGLYDLLWNPKDHGYCIAGDLIKDLAVKIELLKGHPVRFRHFEPTSKYGCYETLLDFARDVLKACKENPKLDIEICK